MDLDSLFRLTLVDLKESIWTPHKSTIEILYIQTHAVLRMEEAAMLVYVSVINPQPSTPGLLSSLGSMVIYSQQECNANVCTFSYFA